MSNKRVFIGGLWSRDTKVGQVISGSFGKAKLVIFPNSKKQGEKSPDFMAYIEEPQERESDDRRGAQVDDPSDRW